MLISASILHLSLGFVVGGSWIALIAWFGEIHGSRVGGFIAGLPSTVAVSFLFIGWNQSAAIAVEATISFPLFYCFAGIFLLSFAVLAGKWQDFWRTLIFSILIWLVFATAATISGIQNFDLSLAVCALTSAAVYLLFTKKLALPKRVSGKRSTKSEVFLRFFIGGGIVSLAVLVSQLAGPRVGVIPTSFPAISCSTLYVLNRTHGLEFSKSFTLPIMVTAMLTVVPFVIAVRELYPFLGIWLGTLGSYIIAIPFAVLAFLILHPESKIISKITYR